MATVFRLHIRSVDRDFYEGDCIALTLPLSDGQLGILGNHSPLVAAVVPGLLTYRLQDGSSVTVAAGSGLVRFEDNDALVLLDSVERPEDIDVRRAENAVARAKEDLLQSRTKQEKLQAQVNLARAENRLRAASKQ